MNIRDLVLSTFEDEVAISRDKLSLDKDLTTDLKIDSDDLTAFAMALEKKINIEIPKNEWLKVGTLEEVIKLVRKYLTLKN